MAQAAAFSDPASKIQLITASDSTDLNGVRGISVGGSGTLAVRLVGDPDTTVTIPATAVQTGVIYPMRVTRVMAASTATDIVGWM